MRFMTFIRWFLLVLIIIGLGLLVTQKLWVPKVVDMILNSQNQTALTPVSASSQNNKLPKDTSQKNSIETISPDICMRIAASLLKYQWKTPGSQQINLSYNDSYVTSNDGVYYLGFTERTSASPCEKIVGLDPSTFMELATSSDGGWVKDKLHVYFNDKLLPQADNQTFKTFDFSWARDKSSVYYNGDKVAGLDPATTHVLGRNDRFVYDKSHFYAVTSYEENAVNTSSLLEKVPFIDTETLVILPGDTNAVYIEDKNGVYMDEGDSGPLAKLPGADPITFKILGFCFDAHGVGGSYAKDSGHVWCGKQLLSGADTASFQYLGTLDYEPPLGPRGVAKDNQCIWNEGIKVVDSKGMCVSSASCNHEAISQSNSSDSNEPVCSISPY